MAELPAKAKRVETSGPGSECRGGCERHGYSKTGRGNLRTYLLLKPSGRQGMGTKQQTTFLIVWLSHSP